MTNKYRTITLKNGIEVLAKSEVLAMTFTSKSARLMIADLGRQGISASIYNKKYIKVN